MLHPCFFSSFQIEKKVYKGSAINLLQIFLQRLRKKIFTENKMHDTCRQNNTSFIHERVKILTSLIFFYSGKVEKISIADKSRYLAERFSYRIQIKMLEKECQIPAAKEYPTRHDSKSIDRHRKALRVAWHATRTHSWQKSRGHAAKVS